jgi:hypothetical protein
LLAENEERRKSNTEVEEKVAGSLLGRRRGKTMWEIYNGLLETLEKTC